MCVEGKASHDKGGRRVAKGGCFCSRSRTAQLECRRERWSQTDDREKLRNLKKKNPK